MSFDRKKCCSFVGRYCTRKFFLALFFGQILSLLLCALGTITQKLVITYNVKTPAFQVFAIYIPLSVIFTSAFISKGVQSMKVLKERWWKYMILALIDVEGNYMTTKAYQYTTLTSVQLLDCLTIPLVVVFSVMFFKAKYRPVHYLGILICLSGIGFLIWADVNSSRNQGPKYDSGSGYKWLGDLLVIAAAVTYAVSNVAEEYVVKTSNITEFLGLLSFFGCFISGANVIIFERQTLTYISWNYEIVFLLCLNTLAAFSFYVFMPVVLQHTSATLVNLTLLTADLYTFFIGLYVFNFTFSNLYIISFVVIVLGVVLFKIFPAESRLDHIQLQTTSSINDESDEEYFIQESVE